MRRLLKKLLDIVAPDVALNAIISATKPLDGFQLICAKECSGKLINRSGDVSPTCWTIEKWSRGDDVKFQWKFDARSQVVSSSKMGNIVSALKKIERYEYDETLKIGWFRAKSKVLFREDIGQSMSLQAYEDFNGCRAFVLLETGHDPGTMDRIDSVLFRSIIEAINEFDRAQDN